MHPARLEMAAAWRPLGLLLAAVLAAIVSLALPQAASALYSRGDAVVELEGDKMYHELVESSSGVAIVEFYAPWWVERAMALKASYGRPMAARAR